MLTRLLLLVVLVAVAVSAATPRWHQLGAQQYNFDTFMKDHGKTYQVDSAEYNARKVR